MIVVIGNPAKWAALGRALSQGEELRFVEFADLSACLIHELDPDLVLSPLIDDGFDAVEVASRLVAAGYRGRFRVVTTRLPNPDAVRAEVEEESDDIDFDLVILGDRPT